ncbi:MAG TPA: Lsr2 family protein, partial [Acidimicrobiales bacterium]|nr:Lsr2 family protein [Acidimicrobiales bacterium]
VTCDLHEGESEAVDTVKFGLDGYDYEIDLCAEHSEQVHQELGDLINFARRAGGARRGRSTSARQKAQRTPRANSATGAAADRERLQAIREWARSQGYDVKSRGRIPQTIVEEYEAAHAA